MTKDVQRSLESNFRLTNSNTRAHKQKSKSLFKMDRVFPLPPPPFPLLLVTRAHFSFYFLFCGSSFEILDANNPELEQQQQQQQQQQKLHKIDGTINDLPNFGNFGASFADDTADKFIGHCHFLRLLRRARLVAAALSASGAQLAASQCG